MEMADYWLVEKQLIHKLFKVLVPRYENYDISFTRMFNAPKLNLNDGYKKAILELRGNPYPSLLPNNQTNRNLIHNVLLDEAKKAYRAQKYKEIANKIGEVEEKAAESNTQKLKEDNIQSEVMSNSSATAETTTTKDVSDNITTLTGNEKEQLSTKKD